MLSEACRSEKDLDNSSEANKMIHTRAVYKMAEAHRQDLLTAARGRHSGVRGNDRRIAHEVGRWSPADVTKVLGAVTARMSACLLVIRWLRGGAHRASQSTHESKALMKYGTRPSDTHPSNRVIG